MCDDPGVDASAQGRAFFRWALAAYLVVTAVLVAIPTARLHGRWVYVLDDPAIHLSVAQNLLHHGTWGVSPGHYESASSSPVWTLLLAALLAPLGRIREALPLLANLTAGLALLKVLSKLDPPLYPSWRRPVQVLGVTALVTIVLFLPGLAVVGMEHTLHALLVVSVVVLFERRRRGTCWGPRWLPYALLATATLTRFETAFIALGIGVGVLLASGDRWRNPGDVDRSLRGRVITVALVGLCSGVPLALFGLFNHAMGQGLLPNSVLYKSQVTGADGASMTVESMLSRFFHDPLLPVFWVAAVLYLVVCRRGRNRSVVTAAALAVAIPLHVILAQVGWYERYQAYLVVLGVAFMFSLSAEHLRDRTPAGSPALAWRRPASVAVAALLIAIPFVHYKVQWTAYAPGSSVDMYRQHYLAGEFLAKYYDDQPIATGELGYISLFHRGPVTDLYGLGDYQVLRYRQEKRDPKAYLADLARTRGFTVVAAYPFTLGMSAPPHWILVGTWVYEGRQYTAIDRRFQFWATTPEAVAPLTANLQAFAKDLPSEEHLDLDGLAAYRAAVQMKDRPAP